jgi:hypothetical protein
MIGTFGVKLERFAPASAMRFSFRDFTKPPDHGAIPP